MGRQNWWGACLGGMAIGCLVAIAHPATAQEVMDEDDSLDFLNELADDPAAPPIEDDAVENETANDVTEPSEPQEAATEEDLPFPIQSGGTGADNETQDTGPEIASDTPPPPSGGGAKLDEIIVTAQKRAENVQDVPLSVTAIGAEALKDNNLSDLTSISEFTPNLVILATPTFNYITMRGVGTGFNRGLEQSVAIIIDEVYYGRASYLSNGLLDLQAIEVLRGPQGTLFGKNSAAGAIHLRTANPTPDYEFTADGTYGTYNYWRARGTASGPVPGTSNELMFRLAFQAERNDGFIDNTTLDKKEGDLNQTTMRAKLLWEPSPTFSFLLQGTYGITKQDGTGVQIHQGTPRSIAAMQVFDPKFTDELDDKTALDFPSFVDRNYYEVTGVLTYEFGNGMEVKSITNYAGFSEEVSFDADFSPIPFITLENNEDYSQFSQEIRFTSPPGPFQYVAGLYFLSNEIDALYRVEAFANLVELALITGQLEANQQTAQYSQGGVLAGQAGAALLLQRLNANGGMLDPQESATNPFLQKSDSYAAFFQADWQMSDIWTLVVGNRVSYEKKKLVKGGQILVNEITGVEGNAGLLKPGGSVLFPLIQSGSVSFEDSRQRTEFNVSPKVILRYEGLENGMVYASAAAGYKGGGFNAQPLTDGSTANALTGEPQNRDPALDQVEFEEETSITFEVGTKLDLFDGSGRFNISAFYTFYSNYQSTAFNGVAFVPANVGDTRVMGLEWDGAQALTEWLMLTYSGSFINSKYLDFTNGPCQAFQAPNGSLPNTCSLVGKQFGTTPRFTMTVGVGWDKQLGNRPLRLVGNLTGSYATRTFASSDRDPAVERPEYFLARAAIGLRDLDDRWSVMVYGSNLTGLNQIIDGDDQPTFTGAYFGGRLAPREVKIEVGVRF